MQHYCTDDLVVDGKVLCMRGNIYNIVNAPEDPDSGYCDIHGCDDGSTCNATWLDVDEHFICIAPILVVEVEDGIATAVSRWDSMPEALENANELLDRRLREEGEGAIGDDPEWEYATEEVPVAWLTSRQWAAFVIPI